MRWLLISRRESTRDQSQGLKVKALLEVIISHLLEHSERLVTYSFVTIHPPPHFISIPPILSNIFECPLKSFYSNQPHTHTHTHTPFCVCSSHKEIRLQNLKTGSKNLLCSNVSKVFGRKFLRHHKFLSIKFLDIMFLDIKFLSLSFCFFFVFFDTQIYRSSFVI